ncbi:ProQ/FINO family protein [Marinomonas sp. 2405UD66-6]|uniref:ProQ/FINO family protein n=1 Tax=Marinomonas sp. 2405UD66-6 TaxID=3391834 RepID=UPI0039C99988
MEQLIAKLEAKVNWLTNQLENAQKEISKLKEEHHLPMECSASMDLLQHMVDQQPEDQVQRYITDSLGLLDNSSPINQQQKAVEHQLHFDLLDEHADIDNSGTTTTTTTTEQINDMSIQQPEPQNSPEDTVTNKNHSSTQNASNTSTETATLTPEQKKRQKNQRNNRRLIKMLEDRYPKAFDWNQPKPLKVGIDQDMVLDDDFNASKQKRALAAYTRSDRYKKCLLSGQPRVDLEGIAINDEPALPKSMSPTKPKTKNTKTSDRPDREKNTQQRRKPKLKNQTRAKQNSKPTNTPRQDDLYDNLSPEERMKAKLEKLLNKS